MSYVLIMYAWTFSVHAGGGLAMATFGTKVACETAASNAKKEFDGVYSRMYHVCVPQT